MSSPSSPVPNLPSSPVAGQAAHIAGLPATVVARLAAMFNRMTTAGVTEPLQVYGHQTVYQQNTPVARGPVLLTTLQAYVAVGGGALQLAPEALRAQVSEIAFFQPDPTGSLTEASYPALTVVLPYRSGARRFILQMQTFGPYQFCFLRAGGTSAPAGA